MINTFMKPHEDAKRVRYTIDFLRRYIHYGRTVLDIGEKNPIGKYTAAWYDLKLDNTSGDLDYNFTAPKKGYDIVFCFEMIEHLMSPKFFLLELKKYITVDTQIFITYPSRPKFLWTDLHFHEYDRKRFEYLIDSCGYKILDWQVRRASKPFSEYITGIRPLLRLIFGKSNLVYIKPKR